MSGIQKKNRSRSKNRDRMRGGANTPGTGGSGGGSGSSGSGSGSSGGGSGSSGGGSGSSGSGGTSAKGGQLVKNDNDSVGSNPDESNGEAGMPIIFLDMLSKIISDVFQGKTYKLKNFNDDQFLKERVDALVKILNLYKTCVETFKKDNITAYFENLEAYREFIAKLCYSIAAIRLNEEYQANTNIVKVGAVTQFAELNILANGLYEGTLNDLWSTDSESESKKYYFAMYKGVLGGDIGDGDAGVLDIMNALCQKEKEADMTFKEKDFTDLLASQALASHLEILKTLCEGDANKMYETYENSMYINYASFFIKSLQLNGGSSLTPPPPPPPYDPELDKFIGRKCLDILEDAGITSRANLIKALINQTITVSPTLNEEYSSFIEPIGATTKLNDELTLYDKYISVENALRTSYANDGKGESTALDEETVKKIMELAKVSLTYNKTTGIQFDRGDGKDYSRCLRNNQLMAIILFLNMKNLLIQAGTGQGKSYIVAVTAIVLKLLHPNNPIHVITATNELAKEGYNDVAATSYAEKHHLHPVENLADLFRACKVRASLIKTDAFKGYGANAIIYGTPYDFISLALEESSEKNLKYTDPELDRIIILDESDVNLIDSADGSVKYTDDDPDNALMQIVLNEITEIVKKDTSPIDIDKITKDYIDTIIDTLSTNDSVKPIFSTNKDFKERCLRELPNLIKNALKVYKTTEYEEGVNFHLKKSLLDEITSITTKGAIDDPKIKKFFETLRGLFSQTTQDKPNMERIQKELIIALEEIKNGASIADIITQLIYDEHSAFNRIIKTTIEMSEIKNPNIFFALINDGSIQYLEGSGQIIGNMTYGGGIQQFLEKKYLDKIVTDFTLSYRSFSFNRYVRESKHLFGLSGTAGLAKELREFQMKLWNIEEKPVVLPDFKEKQLKHSKDIGGPDDQRKLGIDEWNAAILAEIDRVTKDQPVLIVTENPKRADDLTEFLKKSGKKVGFYIESTNSYIKEKELKPNDIIVTTNLGGRGTDYKIETDPDKTGYSKGGLHVIVGYETEENRNFLQAIGRAGRAGNPGSWILISSGDPLKGAKSVDNIKMAISSSVIKDLLFEVYKYLEDLHSDSKSIANPLNPQQQVQQGGAGNGGAGNGGASGKDDRMIGLIGQWFSREDIQQEFVNLIFTQSIPLPKTLEPREKVDEYINLVSQQIIKKIEGFIRTYSEKALSVKDVSDKIRPFITEIIRLELPPFNVEIMNRRAQLTVQAAVTAASAAARAAAAEALIAKQRAEAAAAAAAAAADAVAKQKAEAEAAAAKAAADAEAEAKAAAAAEAERQRLATAAAEAAAAQKKKEEEAAAAEEERLRQEAAAKIQAAKDDTERREEEKREAERKRLAEIEKERKKAEAAAAAAAAAAEEQRLRKEAEARAEAKREEERKRVEAEAAAAEEERKRVQAAAAAAEEERVRQEKDALEKEKERKRREAEARAQKEEAERQRVAEAERQRLAEAAAAAEAERQRLAAEAAAAAEAERQRVAAAAAAEAEAEAERQRLAAEAAEAERQRLAAEAAEAERKRLAAEAAEAERKRLEDEQKKRDALKDLETDDIDKLTAAIAVARNLGIVVTDAESKLARLQAEKVAEDLKQAEINKATAELVRLDISIEDLTAAILVAEKLNATKNAGIDVNPAKARLAQLKAEKDLAELKARQKSDAENALKTANNIEALTAAIAFAQGLNNDGANINLDDANTKLDRLKAEKVAEDLRKAEIAKATDALTSATTTKDLQEAIHAAEQLNAEGATINLDNARKTLAEMQQRNRNASAAQAKRDAEIIAATAALKDATTIDGLEAAIRVATQLKINLGDAQARLNTMKKKEEERVAKLAEITAARKALSDAISTGTIEALKAALARAKTAATIAAGLNETIDTSAAEAALATLMAKEAAEKEKERAKRAAIDACNTIDDIDKLTNAIQAAENLGATKIELEGPRDKLQGLKTAAEAAAAAAAAAKAQKEAEEDAAIAELLKHTTVLSLAIATGKLLQKFPGIDQRKLDNVWKRKRELQKAEDDARKIAEEERKKAEEEAKRKAEEERKKAEDARKKADDARKIAEEERKKAEEEAKRKAEEERKKAEDARKKADDARKIAEEERKKAEEEAKRKAEEEARDKPGGGGQIISGIQGQQNLSRPFFYCWEDQVQGYQASNQIVAIISTLKRLSDGRLVPKTMEDLHQERKSPAIFGYGMCVRVAHGMKQGYYKIVSVDIYTTVEERFEKKMRALKLELDLTKNPQEQYWSIEETELEATDNPVEIHCPITRKEKPQFPKIIFNFGKLYSIVNVTGYKSREEKERKNEYIQKIEQQRKRGIEKQSYMGVLYVGNETIVKLDPSVKTKTGFSELPTKRKPGKFGFLDTAFPGLEERVRLPEKFHIFDLTGIKFVDQKQKEASEGIQTEFELGTTTFTTFMNKRSYILVTSIEEATDKDAWRGGKRYTRRKRSSSPKSKTFKQKHKSNTTTNSSKRRSRSKSRNNSTSNSTR